MPNFGHYLSNNIMNKNNNTSFGEYIRHLREERKFPLRKIAFELDIDISTLSKIEKNERNANEQIIDKLSEIFNLNKSDLKIIYLSDKITYQLLKEEDGLEILKVAEEKIKYHKLQ